MRALITAFCVGMTISSTGLWAQAAEVAEVTKSAATAGNEVDHSGVYLQEIKKPSDALSEAACLEKIGATWNDGICEIKEINRVSIRKQTTDGVVSYTAHFIGASGSERECQSLPIQMRTKNGILVGKLDADSRIAIQFEGPNQIKVKENMGQFEMSNHSSPGCGPGVFFSTESGIFLKETGL